MLLKFWDSDLDLFHESVFEELTSRILAQDLELDLEMEGTLASFALDL